MTQPTRASDLRPRIRFDENTDFQHTLRKRVEQFFRDTGLRPRDCPRMYLKTLIIFSTFALSYALLVFAAQEWWQALPLALVLGLSAAAIGFNIQHDGGHKAYSDRAWINKLMAMSLDLVGGSSYVWRWKHAVFHHMFVNIKDHDSDIDLGFFGRLSPEHRRRAFHRWQHWYLWPLYGVMTIKWHFFDDFHDVATGRIGANPFPRPRNWELLLFLAGKSVFFSMAFLLPFLLHPVWVVLLFYVITVVVTGVVLSVVFQLAHCVEGAEFPLPDQLTGQIRNTWAVHQIESTLNFARDNKFACWLLGGLNFQIEHHLFPRVCHTNYPAISALVKLTCQEFGVRYTENRTFRGGVASHFRWLRRMGTAEAK
ncbi:MAG TPA: acyl-CoA desaturase [Gammaproteobacteria bacterium]|nr:acyl-CoA desaturase [Gammaproteobacteria bacterium]